MEKRREKRTVRGIITSNKKIAENLFLMTIKEKWLVTKSKAGQFVNVKVAENSTDPLLRIPLGIHQIKKEGISLLYKVVGRGTKILSSKQAKGSIDVLGPLGTPFDISNTDKNTMVIVISGGHGLAPLFALSEELRRKKHHVEFFMGARTGEHLVRDKELKKIGVIVHKVTDDGSCGFKGCVTDAVEKVLAAQGKKYAKKQIFACGPLPMIKAVAAIAAREKIPAQVTRDEYMACGIGACRGCAVRTKEGIKLACTDGPVFDAAILEW
ncbi:MAG TPA: dihydroorotate dehydrogenase electron transfer subunit [Candidatus Omnitrophota bacterium]|nr:dihydroorotate dehydrogenase electron transfer subunit [Candidatus Omnitrophota bacterium]HPS21036.1 dihydroorotate dehydrogenase electron transfer subunit [Candidatus Omnitrophota bacterium]